jgi:hypothetical protein
MSSDPSDISLVLFHAAAEPELVALYHSGQLASYGRHGATAAAERTRDIDPEGVHMVAAIGPGLEVLAGMRIHHRRPGQRLPVELALGDHCPISAAIDARRPAPVVEMSGLWVAEAHRQGPLAAAVTRTALAACRTLGARSVVGCVHQYILPFYQRYGAIVETSLGVHPYPSPRYATQVVFSDLMANESAMPAEQTPLRPDAGVPLALAC